jgi:hypothetical protein
MCGNFVEHNLEYLIYGQYAAETANYMVLAHSDGFSPTDAAHLKSLLPLDPLPGIATEQAVACLPLTLYPGAVIVAQVQWREADATRLYHFVRLPSAALPQLDAQWSTLLALLHSLPTTPQMTVVAPLTLAAGATWSTAARTAAVSAALALLKGDFHVWTQLVGAALHARHLVIQHCPLTQAERLTLLHGLRASVPPILRENLSFTTHTLTVPEQGAAVVFSDQPAPTPRWRWDWASASFGEELPTTPYTAYLRETWQGNPALLVENISAVEQFAARFVELAPSEALQVTLVRQQLDRQINREDSELALDAVIEALHSPHPPQGELYLQYYRRLAQIALEQRQPQACEVVAQAMDSDVAVEHALQDLFAAALQTMPDAVYVFARARLSENVDEKWLIRLHEAAVRSLEVALAEGDAETLAKWLKLLSREPSRYRLGNVLHEGMLMARERVTDGGLLAQDLLVLAVKRDPEILPLLLHDERVLAALPADLRGALLEHDAPLIEALAPQSPQLFLLALMQAIASHSTISATSIKVLWELYTSPTTLPVSEPYQPLTLLHALTDPATALNENAFEALFTLILAATEDELFRNIFPIAPSEERQQMIVNALEQSGRAVDDVLTLLNTLVNDGKLNFQDVALMDALLFLNTSHGEDSEAVAENLARLLSQHAEVDVTTGVLWKMVELAAETRSDLMVRVAVKRLLIEIGEIATESGQIDALLRLRKATHWSSAARTIVITWWRTFVRGQPLAQLQKLEKALDARRKDTIEDLRQVLLTALAVRRVLGQKSLEEFAQEISVTYRVLQALADSFDPENKQTFIADTLTLRALFGAQADDIAPDSKQVLATNLRELAQVITSLADNRSKPTLLSRDDTVDRALMSGEQQPESALDVMKYLAGFLDGTQSQKNHEGV